MQVTVACPLLPRGSGDGQILRSQPSSIVISKPMRDTASKQGKQLPIRTQSPHMCACGHAQKRAVGILCREFSHGKLFFPRAVMLMEGKTKPVLVCTQGKMKPVFVCTKGNTKPVLVCSQAFLARSQLDHTSSIVLGCQTDLYNADSPCGHL